MSDSAGGARVVVFTTDMIFSTKITSTCKSLEVPARALTRLGRLTTINMDDLKLALIDMDADEAAGAIEFVAGLSNKPEVVAFYSHVRGDLREAAQAAGATQVMTRSKFVDELPGLVEGVQG